MSRATPVLLEALCPLGHSWDLWAEERAGRIEIEPGSDRCPSCEFPPMYAVEIREPESLA